MRALSQLEYARLSEEEQAAYDRAVEFEIDRRRDAEEAAIVQKDKRKGSRTVPYGCSSVEYHPADVRAMDRIADNITKTARTMGQSDMVYAELARQLRVLLGTGVLRWGDPSYTQVMQEDAE